MRECEICCAEVNRRSRSFSAVSLQWLKKWSLILDLGMVQVIIWSKSHGNKRLPKFKLISQSIWFNLIHVLLLLIVIVGLGFFFLLILINIQINKMSFIIFCYKIFIYLFLTPHPQHLYFFLGYTPGDAAAPSAPLLPVVMIQTNPIRVI